MDLLNIGGNKKNIQSASKKYPEFFFYLWKIRYLNKYYACNWEAFNKYWHLIHIDMDMTHIQYRHEMWFEVSMLPICHLVKKGRRLGQL